MADETLTEQQGETAITREVTLPPAEKDPTLRLLFYFTVIGVIIEGSLDQVITFIRGAVGI
tara:strand:+ start:855 stop:1037 length:183 start_codon:yes stop_codon:yes gene_type:complete